MGSNLSSEVTAGTGYAVVKADDIALMEWVRDRVLDGTSTQLGMPRDLEGIRRKLAGVSEAEVIKLRGIPLDGVLVAMLKAFKTSIAEISGNNLFVQRRPFLMFNVPNLNTENTEEDERHVPSMSHIDAMSGISPHTMILWAPLHDLDDDTGVWIIDQHRSMHLLNKEKTAGRVMGKNILDINSPDMRGHLVFAPLAFGEAVIFNGFCLHGSISNTTERSRVCVNFRFQSRDERLFLKSSEFFTPYDLH